MEKQYNVFLGKGIEMLKIKIRTLMLMYCVSITASISVYIMSSRAYATVTASAVQGATTVQHLGALGQPAFFKVVTPTKQDIHDTVLASGIPTGSSSLSVQTSSIPTLPNTTPATPIKWFMNPTNNPHYFLMNGLRYYVSDPCPPMQRMNAASMLLR